MGLNQQQQRAAEYTGPAKHVLVIAGAGTGKTKTIISRIEYLIHSGVNTSSIVLLTFTNRAAKNMMTRLRQSLKGSSDGIYAGTFHGFCRSIMSSMPKSFGISGLNIIDRDDQVSIMGIARSCFIDKKNVELQKLIPTPAELADLYSFARNTCTPIIDFITKNTQVESNKNEIIELQVNILNEYKNYKSARGYVDFDDLLEIFADTLEKKHEMRRYIMQAFKHIAVDEMQDTNPIQFRILKIFAQENAHLFCVGDPAQSIFKFRGAEFKHIHNFNKHFPDSEILPLSINYRSNQEILDLSNWLLKKSPLNYQNMLTAHKGKSNNHPSLIDFNSKTDEANWIGNFIDERHNEGEKYRNIMVMIRSAWAGREIETELSCRGIPYKFVGGTAISKSAHVKDLFSLLRVVINSKDELAWVRYLELWPRIGSVKASKTANIMFQCDPGMIISELQNNIGSNHDLVKAYHFVQSNNETTVSSVKAAIVSLAPLLSKNYDRWEHRVEDFKLLTKVAEKYSDLKEFIEAFTLEPISNTQIQNSDDDDVLTLITVHSAKGAESKICIIAQAQKGMFPHSKSLDNEDDIEEERRILYVGLTRAKEELFITRTMDNGHSFASVKTKAPGEDYFLSIVPDHLVKKEVMGWKPTAMSAISKFHDIF